MRERIVIVVGVAIFLVLFTYPLWHAAVASTQAKPPQLQLPADARECVAPIPYMRAEHMQLLINWRENVVRRGVRQVHAANGKVYDASLTRTCLGCHSRSEFCDKCHSYSGVSAPTCWQCHNEPKLTPRRMQ
ncbi:MAG: sulfate reduction electron transfer complex DsrMKJOP subunit DsrJ [Candidatus Korobacteraceae bacterium]|jgi:hypothetical protein